jgi:endonuclease YncB( thermonuclease family)
MGGIAPGWYPDYEAPPGHQRYWDGARWTERRSGVPEEEPQAGVEEQVRRFAPWLLAAVVVLVVISAAVLVVGDDQTARSDNNPSPPPASSTPGPPPSEETEPEEETEPDRRTWQVEAVVDGSTLSLTNGAEVRMVGIADSCGADVLAAMVVGNEVTLTRRGPDKNADGRLLRYVERGGIDAGKRLIQRGLAKASDEPNARRDIYRRVDERSPDRC